MTPYANLGETIFEPALGEARAAIKTYLRLGDDGPARAWARDRAKISTALGIVHTTVFAALEAAHDLGRRALVAACTDPEERASALRGLAEGTSLLRRAFIDAHMALHTSQVERLHELAVALNGENSLPEVGRVLLEGARELTSAGMAGMILIGEGGQLEPLCFSGVAEGLMASVQATLLGGQVESAGGALRRAVRLPDARSNFPVAHRLLDGVCNLLAVPLVSRRGDVLGVLAVANKMLAAEFSAEDQQVCEMLAAHAGAAVDNIRLQQQLRRRIERTEIINELARAIAANNDLQNLAAAISRALRRQLEFSVASLLSLDDARATAVLLTIDSAKPEPAAKVGDGLSVPLEVKAMVDSREPRLFNELPHDHPTWLFLRDVGLRSAMIVPLVTSDRVVAFLAVGSQQQNPYRADDLGFVSAVADQIAPALESARLLQALKKSEAMYHALFRACPDPIAVTDLDGTIVDASERALELQGVRDMHELYGKRLFDMIVPAEHERAKDKLDLTLRTGHSGTVELDMLHGDGTRFPGELTAALVQGELGEPASFIAIVRDITARKRAEARFRSYQAQLRSLASELSLAEERLRQHIAAELHDEISQTLVFAKLKLGTFRAALSGAGLARDLEEMRQLLDDTIQRVQTLVWEISSPILSELGLEAAIQWLADRLQQKHGIICHVDDDGQDKPVPGDLRVVLFQAVRELLLNVTKHAQSQHALVTVRRVDQNIEITVADAGVGFDPSELGHPRAKDKGGGFGLFSVRERLFHLGGTLEIDSVRGAGTTVKLVAPLGQTPQRRSSGSQLQPI